MTACIINGKSTDYGWGLTEDGQGIVVWKGSWFEIYERGTTLSFNDKAVDTDYLFNGGGNTGGNTSGTEFAIDGNSADYGWGLTEDGQGIVVWKGSWFQVLSKGTALCFNDKAVNTDYLFNGGGNTGGNTSGTEFAIDGNSADYGWGLTEDGQGIVVWKGSWFQVLTKGTALAFCDKTVSTDYLFNGGSEDPVNHDPVANDDSAATDAGVKVTGNVLGNDNDPDGDTLTVSLENGPKNGSLTLNPDGTFSYQPNAGFTGTDTFSYVAADGKGGCDNATVTITVKKPEPVNTASIGDRVWLDANKNGVQDSGEAGVAGVTVQLKDSNGNVIATQVTNTNGDYLFDKLAAGNYQVGITAPSQYELTAKDAFGNGADGIDSDFNAANGHTDTITLKDGEAIRTVDAGLVAKPVAPTASIGDRVWLDANKNGLQDTGEAGVAGVTVQLKDASGATIATQQTNAQGDYLFDKLAAGNYSVNVVKPADYNFTSQDALGNGADGVDSDVNASGSTGTIALKDGEAIRTVDAGLVSQKTGSIGDTVWEDANFNGVQDIGEQGIANATVKLTDANGTIVGTTTTDASGKYLFDKLAAGDYKVQVTGPNGYYVTKSNIGSNDAADSDIGADGITGVIRLNDGQHITDVDAGLYRKASLGDHVWLDGPAGVGDGIQQDNGTGSESLYFFIPSGVTVYLLNANGDVVATTRTDAKGDYKFTNLDPGQYKVVFDRSTANDADIRSSFVWTQKDMGTNDALDSDVTPTGTQKAYLFGSSTAQAITDTITLESGEHDGTIDAGLRWSPVMLDLNGDGKIGVTGETTSKDGTGVTSIGHTVSFDINADGVKEQIEWSDGKGDGLLVDMTKIGTNGEIDGKALFGDEGGKYANGYDKLALHDANGDGTISGDELASLGVWKDDGDAVLEDGEMISAADAGITSVSATMQIAYDADGRELMQSSAQVNGETILTEDVWFASTGEDASTADADAGDLAPLTCDCDTSHHQQLQHAY